MRKMLSATILISLSAPAIGQNFPPPSTGPQPHISDQRRLSDQQILHIYQNKLKPLRAEILARKAAEGGELSEASHAEFQARLDQANKEFARFMKKMDVQGYDAWGDREG